MNIDKSMGHLFFEGGYEYFIAESGNVYRADAALPVMPDGYRCGRWFAYNEQRAVEYLAAFRK